MTLAKKARQHTPAGADLHSGRGENRGSESDRTPLYRHPANEFTVTSARELQTQLARQKLAARQMRERIETLSQQVVDSDNRYADLEDELNVVREEILLQQNEKHALQAARDLLITENARLTGCLNESNAALDQAREQIERHRTTLDTATLTHNTLSAAVEEANERQRVANDKLDAANRECRTLTAALSVTHRKHQIEAANLKAAKIDRNKLITALDRANQKNQAHGQKLKALQVERDRLAAALNKNGERHRDEIASLKSHLEAATSRAITAETLVAKVRDVLLEKFTQLQASVATRNCELHDLERSRLRLIDGTKMLLEIFAMRDVALARADAQIRFLTDRVADLEAESRHGKAWREITLVNGSHNGFLEQRAAGDEADRANVNVDDDMTDRSSALEAPPLYLASTTLAATITF